MTFTPTESLISASGDSPAGDAPGRVSGLTNRIVTGLVLVTIFVAAVVLDEWLSPWYPCWFLLTMIATGKAALEIVGLLNQTSARPSANAVFGGVLALVVANWVPHVLAWRERAGPLADDLLMHDPAHPVSVFSWILWTFVAILMFTFIAQSAQFVEPGRTMATIAGTVLAVAYVGVLGGFIIQHRWLGGPRGGLIALASLIATAKGADTGAYILGRIAGEHKLWPRLSPNKTVEGALGGMVFGVLAALLVEALAHLLVTAPTLGWRGAMGYGMVVGAAAQLGDLMESMIKRDCARKDASDALPGFGGFLDVLDSLLFAAPVAYTYWMAFAA